MGKTTEEKIAILEAKVAKQKEALLNPAGFSFDMSKASGKVDTSGTYFSQEIRKLSASKSITLNVQIDGQTKISLFSDGKGFESDMNELMKRAIEFIQLELSSSETMKGESPSFTVNFTSEKTDPERELSKNLAKFDRALSEYGKKGTFIWEGQEYSTSEKLTEILNGIRS